ncbi:MAG: hypothetical protein FJ137_17265 [Deltaproteobacteria bacterium]|nr:hypothetical protein [Deltaproteobacteria bacterium]
MTLGIQRSHGSTSPLAEQRRTALEATEGVGEQRSTAPACDPEDAATPAAAAPKASAETVQAARQRALGLEKQLLQRIDCGGRQEAHHRKGHIVHRT